MNKYLLSTLLCSLVLFSCTEPELVQHAKWSTVTLDFEGPDTDEQATENPFSDYRMEVTFQHENKSVSVPGYFAADGNAAESSADAGSIWRVKFVPDLEGLWQYTVSFKQGKNIAIADDPKAGKACHFNGASGKFLVGPINQNDPSTLKGRLSYANERYLKFQEDGTYFLKGGPNSPENFLAYSEFDGTYASDTSKQFIKEYEPHLQDWKAGDPTWQEGKGKGIIGAINYIANRGMNVIYMLTMNIEGDGRDVWPYTDHQQFDRFDCSKLDQWNIVFEHAQDLGVMLHFVTQETENELLLDKGDTGFFRKLYYRELIARFGHHLMITWNLGEENGYASFTPQAQNDRQRKDMATYIKQTDPYDNYLVVHTHSWEGARDTIVDSLYNFQYIDGLSLQIDKRKVVHRETKKYIERSKEAGRIWVSSMDEIGLYWMGAMPDKDDPGHDTLRQEVLWGHLMAGGPGVEWYFGYKYPPADLDCQDWRSRDTLWMQTKAALDFFRAIPFWEMESHDELIDHQDGYCFAKPGEQYVVYLKKQSNTTIKLEKEGGYMVQWFEPKDNTELLQTRGFSEAGSYDIEWPFGFADRDLVVLLTKE